MTLHETRTRYAQRDDQEVVAVYGATIDMIETVATNQMRDGIRDSDARELSQSRTVIHRDLAYLGMLLIERQIEL